MKTTFELPDVLVDEVQRRARDEGREYARISLARDLIRVRRAAGLTQAELAALARTRQETISRIESGKHTASHRLIDRIDRALKSAAKRRKMKGR